MSRFFCFPSTKKGISLWPSLGYGGIALLAALPLWIVTYPPLQDLPFHLATIRIFHSLHDASFGFDQDFVLRLGETQYLFYDIIASLLASCFGVIHANLLLVSIYLAGTPLALRKLLHALGREERLCLFAVPLLYNVMFLAGLLPFLLGIPLMFWALAEAVLFFATPSWTRGLLLSLLGCILFACHVFPFGLFACGVIAMFPWHRPRKWWCTAPPFLPPLSATLWWLLSTPIGTIGQSVLLERNNVGIKSMEASIQDVGNWLTDIFRDGSGMILLVASLVIALGTVMVAQKELIPKRTRRSYVVVPLTCLALYFLTGEQYGHVWMVAQRFPILCLLTAIPLLRFPHGARGVVATVLITSLGVIATANTSWHFVQFQKEIGDIDGAIAAMKPRKHVAALIYDRGSRIMNWSPFLHFGSYYQVQKGGVVQFTYAGYPHWPIDFLPGRYPPPGGPARLRWEWTPQQVSVEEELIPYYDYVLTRGAGFSPPQGTYHLIWQGNRWKVWSREF